MPTRCGNCGLSKYLYNLRHEAAQVRGESRDDLCAFPAEARRAAGFELWQVQLGARPSDWKPMADVGPGAYEIRVHVLGEWRVIYVTKLAEAVYVLHAFQKKTRRTRRDDVKLARLRYQAIGV
ncbi:MAG: type II toxin-antitoxin system RelE/ParE family toxin [Gammaproteobacteria bacterium]